MVIGPRLRAARAAAGLSIRTLAEHTGFSPSFLSQVELGQSSPSISSLQQICAALHLDIGELLRGPATAESRSVVRRSSRELLRSEWSKATAESLLPDGGDERFSALLLTLDPGGKTGPMKPRPGARELALCIRGKVVLTLGRERHELTRGDSVLLDRSLASWENAGRSRSEVVLVSARVS